MCSPILLFATTAFFVITRPRVKNRVPKVSKKSDVKINDQKEPLAVYDSGNLPGPRVPSVLIILCKPSYGEIVIYRKPRHLYPAPFLCQRSSFRRARGDDNSPPPMIPRSPPFPHVACSLRGFRGRFTRLIQNTVSNAAVVVLVFFVRRRTQFVSANSSFTASSYSRLMAPAYAEEGTKTHPTLAN